MRCTPRPGRGVLLAHTHGRSHAVCARHRHKAQQIGAHYALEQLGIIEAQLLAQNEAAEKFASAELKQVWRDLSAVREASFVAIRQAASTLKTLEARSQRAQDESHTRIMIYQLVRCPLGPP
jgi:site-specific recombinase